MVTWSRVVTLSKSDYSGQFHPSEVDKLVLASAGVHSASYGFKTRGCSLIIIIIIIMRLLVDYNSPAIARHYA